MVLRMEYPTINSLQKLYVLGGEVAESSAKCTHLVAAKVIRTVKFLVSLPTVQNIVTSEWLEQSFRAQYFLDPRRFPLRDAEAEVEFNFNLEESMRKAQTRRIFQGLHFYITPGICPSLSTMRTIASAGDGRLLPKQPSWQQVFDHQRGKSLPEIVIISCSNDLHLCKNYFAHSIDVHNGEFILTGMITQKLDYETYPFL
uniref:PAX-interacting protein 1 n=1 Tax=Eptatretus burgeri TaxID=7764 RepID=A0A8C4N5N7_EPTBU